jgi:hypothetical protein
MYSPNQFWKFLMGTSNNSILFPNLGFFSSYCACLPAKAGYQNTHPDSYRDSVFCALYLKKIPVLVFQKELIEVPLCQTNPEKKFHGVRYFRKVHLLVKFVQ